MGHLSLGVDNRVVDGVENPACPLVLDLGRATCANNLRHGRESCLYQICLYDAPGNQLLTAQPDELLSTLTESLGGCLIQGEDSSLSVDK